MDEDAMDGDLVRALRNHGVDVLTAADAGTEERADEDQLAWAHAEGRVLYTYNFCDYYRIHTDLLSNGKDHAGLIVGVQRAFKIGSLLRRLLRLVNQRSAESM